MKRSTRSKAFTLAELMIVVTVILILATFVVLNVTNARKKAILDKQKTNANLVANALDQYAISNGRKFPLPSTTGTLVLDKYYVFTLSSLSSVTGFSALINSDNVLNDAAMQYVVRGDLKNAAIIVKPTSSTEKLSDCKFTDSSDVPTIVKQYVDNNILNEGGGDIANSPCYYVAR